MNGKQFSDAMSEVNDKYINEALSYKSEVIPSTHFKRRVPFVLIAAIVALLLVSCAVAVTIYGDSIQNWFEHQWEAITGQSMSDGQTAVIDHLSQEIGASQTVGDVTITVDSATVGDDTFFLLLRVEGLKFSKKHSYNFTEITMDVAPDPLGDAGGLGSFGFQYQGLDGNGAALMLMDYNYASMAGYMEDSRPLEVTLNLENLVRNAHTNRRKVLAEGEWNFTFPLDRTRLPATISLPDTEVMMMEHDKRKEVPILFTNIELTNTGIRFQYADHEGTLAISDRLEVVLENGVVIGHSGGIGSPLEGGSKMNCSYQWQIPVNLDEVVAIQIGSTKISVP